MDEKPRRRWFAFSLRTLLWAMTCAAAYAFIIAAAPLAGEGIRDGGPSDRAWGVALDLTTLAVPVVALFFAPRVVRWYWRGPKLTGDIPTIADSPRTHS